MKKYIVLIVLSLLVCIVGCKNNKYTINFYVDNELVKTVKVNKNEEVQAPSVHDKETMKFVGWDKDLSSINSNIDVYALFENITYVVKYYVDDTLVNTITKTKNDVLGSYVPQSHKENYEFNGWYDIDNKEVTNDHVVSSDLSLYAKYDETFSVKFVSLGKEVMVKTIKKGESVILPTLEDSEHAKFVCWTLNDQPFDETMTISNNIVLEALWDIELFKIEGNDVVNQLDNALFNIVTYFDDIEEDIEFESSNYDVLDFSYTSNNQIIIETYNGGEAIITGKVLYHGKTYCASIKVTVEYTNFNIEYDMTSEDYDAYKDQLFDTFNQGQLPLTLPVLEKEDFLFVGWNIEGFKDCYTVIEDDPYFLDDLIMTPCFVYPFISVHTSTPLISANEETTIECYGVNIPEDLLVDGFVFASTNESIIQVDSKGVVKGISEGYAYVNVTLKSNNKINSTVGITVDNINRDTNKLIDLFIQMNTTNTFAKRIKVFGWQKTYDHDLYSSITGYLFENFEVIENIAPLSNSNRPGTIKEKKYVCVHDTGDAEYSAKQWSDTVYTNYSEQTNSTYGASFNYVVGNDGIYHNIPDNEVSYHAGDGTSVSYSLKKTGVFGNNENCVITISDDGYYEFDGVKSVIEAPKKTIAGKTIPATTSEINDAGLRFEIIDGEYYMGPTWYSTDYKRVSNKGGNNNSVGIESCVTYGTDIFYTWQKTAKLVGKLLDDFNLTRKDIVPHHYFSGKDCPMTMRAANLWEYFKDLCVNEYNVYQFIKKGYSVSFSCDSPYVNSVGRIIKLPKTNEVVDYTITVTYEGVSTSVRLSTIINGEYTFLN